MDAFARRALDRAQRLAVVAADGQQEDGCFLLRLGAQLGWRRVRRRLSLPPRGSLRIAPLLLLRLDRLFQMIGEGGTKGRVVRGVEGGAEERLAPAPVLPRRDVLQSVAHGEQAALALV